MTHNRKPCSLGQEKCQPRTLVEEIFCVARHSELPARELAARIGLSYPLFIKRTEDTLIRAAAPAWLMLALAVHTGRTAHIERLARDAGLVVFPMPATGRLRGHVSDTLKEFGEFIQEFGERMRDGVITEDEWPEIERQGHEAISAIAAAIEAAKPAALKTPALKAVGGER